MSAIKTLRASGTRVQADVALGVADNGSTVTVCVAIDRIKNEELATAMAPLENLLKRIAEERTGQAKANSIIDAKIAERLPQAVAKEKERLAAVKEAEVRDAVRKAESDRLDAINNSRGLRRSLDESQSVVDARNGRIKELTDQIQGLQADLATLQARTGVV